MQIKWTEPALMDLEHIRDYIANDSPDNAQHFVERALAATDKLKTFPHIGRPVPEDPDQHDIRELIFQGYRIFYKTLDHEIQIIAMIHGSRNLRTHPYTR